MLLLLLSLSLVSAAPAPLVDPAHSVAPADALWRYVGPSGQAEEDASAIAERILAAPQARHVVWRPELTSWTVWYQVPDLVRAVAQARVVKKLSYTGGGPIELLTAAEIADRIRAEPTTRHLVWRKGMVSWLPAARLAEVDEALRLGVSGALAPAEPPPVVLSPTVKSATPPIPTVAVAPPPPIPTVAVTPSPPVPTVAVAPPPPIPTVAVTPSPPIPTVAVTPPPPVPTVAVTPPPPPVPTVAAVPAPPDLDTPPPIPDAFVDLSAVPPPPTTVTFAPAIPVFDFVPPAPDTVIVSSPPIVPGEGVTPLFEPPPVPGSIPDFSVEEVPPPPPPR